MVLDSDFGRDAPPLSSDDDAAIVFHRVGEELTFARWREAATLVGGVALVASSDLSLQRRSRPFCPTTYQSPCPLRLTT